MEKLNDSQFMAKKRGGLLINDTAEHTGSWRALECEAETAFSIIEVDGVAVDVTGQYLSDPLAAVGMDVMIAKLAAHGAITKVKLASGSCYAING